MKRIIMYVYGDITTDARVQRAADALSERFDVTVISKQLNKKLYSSSFKNVLVGRTDYSFRSYFRTIIEARRIIKKEHPDILYGHDYYSALLLKMFLGRKSVSRIVYDAHELYIPEKGKPFSLRSRFFYWIEKSIVNKVDLLISASQERAERMQEHYLLSSCPVVIRNISKLTVAPEYIPEAIGKSLQEFFELPGMTVVYAGAVIQSRRLNELVEAVSKLAPQFKLLVVGGGSALQELKLLAQNNDSLISLFTGPVPYSALGAILKRCDVGFIYYPVDTLNNIYCASNKLYEYASVYLPILSNENPTIKKELGSYQIGIADDDFERGLNRLALILDTYRKNAATFNIDNDWEAEANKLSTSVVTLLS